uniref:Uncharacterized protein n=1 Tax=Mus musculus TaxID=10090 RepID=Q8BR99_MOUSE|nr:unnamed protein product [Mus musculus]
MARRDPSRGQAGSSSRGLAPREPSRGCHGHPGTWVATALRPTATVREGTAATGRGAGRGDPATRSWRRRAALPGQLPQGGDHERQLQPVVAHGDTERLSKQPPPAPGFSTAASGGEGGASTEPREVQNSPPGSRSRLRLEPWGNPRGDRGGADSGRARPLSLPGECVTYSTGIFCSNLDAQGSRKLGSGSERDLTTQQS